MDDPVSSLRRRALLVGTGAAAFTGAAGVASGYKLRGALPGLRAKPTAASAAIPEFAERAGEIRYLQSRQRVEEVRELKRKYENALFGKARVWEMIEKLGMCIDASDNSLMLTSQFLHVQQILEAMERDGIDDRDLLLIALLHDIGKVMLLAGEVPEHVVGYLTPIGEPVAGAGLERVIFQFGHDEFAYSRLKDHVPEHIAWCIRYHSAMVGTLGPLCNDREQAFLNKYLVRFQPYDLGHKSYAHLPKVHMARYRALIEDTFPKPILF